MKKIILSLFLVLISCTYSQAESSVWKAQKGNSVIYIGGTIHILRQSDFPLPEEYQKAYSSSDMLVFETDLGKANDPSTQQKLLSKAMYMDGSTVQQHLSAETYKKLDEYCAANGIPLEGLKQFKPPIIATMILTTEFSKLGASPNGVDMFFYQAAAKDNKAIGELETIDQQIDLLFKVIEGKEDEFITQTINEINSIKEFYETMVAAWRKGDSGELYDLFVKEMKTEMPDLYQSTLVDRNNNWLPIIENYFGNEKTEFILVGVAHLVGSEGIIEQLIRKGYKVEKL